VEEEVEVCHKHDVIEETGSKLPDHKPYSWPPPEGRWVGECTGPQCVMDLRRRLQLKPHPGRPAFMMHSTSLMIFMV
jgi:hypothetical protein